MDTTKVYRINFEGRRSMTRVLMVLVLISGFPLAKPRPLRIHDYVFNVLGLVTTESGDPIEGAEVTLEVTGPVYDVITTVKTAKRLTDSGVALSSCTSATSALCRIPSQCEKRNPFEQAILLLLSGDVLDLGCGLGNPAVAANTKGLTANRARPGRAAQLERTTSRASS